MATSTTVLLNPNAGLVTTYVNYASLIYTNVQIPFPNSTIGRVLYLKEAGEYPGPSVFSVEPSSGTFVQNSTLLYLNSNQAITLQAFSTTAWSVLGTYGGTSVFSTQVLPVNSVVISPTMKQGNLFADLRTQSKTILLPSISSLTATSNLSPFYTIKDAYGNAAVSTLYISTTFNDTLEVSTINNAIAITQNYASIDLAANRFQNKWHILNYFNGTI